ncbi:MAG: tetratricopeptide repeat protein [Deltaproteobacteria bacterium]|nr:tetratricopeptide repeat protein [Deltaproteobacteria bacterium]MCB9786735.1 tetratricopeptide repeat protein [Deltaproteobacteria bacterium]
MLLCSALAPTGCVTLGNFEKLEARVAELELHRAQLEASMAEDVQRLENLHIKLTEAEQTLRSSGANLGIRMEQIEESLPAVKGQLEAANFQLKGAVRDIDAIKKVLFERLGAASIYLPSDLPKDADGQWKFAQARVKAGDTRQAKAVLDQFEASFPDDPRADDALFQLAQLTEQEGDVTGAIKVYQRVHDAHPKGDKVPEALWRIGELLVAQKDCKRAKSIFEYLGKSYGSSPEGKKTDAKLKALASECK